MSNINNIQNKIYLKSSILKNWNYLFYQADVLAKKANENNRSTSFSFIQRVVIENKGNADFSHCVVEFDVTPKHCEIAPLKIDLIEKGKTTEADHFSITLDSSSAYHLSKIENGTLNIRLKDKDGNILCSSSEEFSFSPLSSSLIGNEIKELLASYVTPEDEKIITLRKDAESILKEKYDSSFGSYSYHDPNKIIEEMDAIYLACQEKELSLSLHSDLVEACLSDIQLPNGILNNKQGNCLDFALLFASLIENSGSNPLIVFLKNDILVGVCLDDGITNDSYIDNGSEILTLTSKGFERILLLDPSGLSKENKLNFKSSVEEAKKKMGDGSSFLYAIDIAASRREHILPLPTPSSDGDGSSIKFIDQGENNLYETPEIDISNRRYIDESSPSRKSKFDYWEEKLLDLSMANRLINMRFSNSFPQILNFNTDLLFSFLSDDDHFVLTSGIDEKIVVSEKHAPFSFESVEAPRFKELLNKKTLFMTSVDANFDSYLKNLARKANTAFEETGCNSLFLSIGVIKWFDNDKAAKLGKGAIYSPLFLLPVKMPKRRNTNGYNVEYSFDDLQLNTTLFEYFKENFDLDFSQIFGEFPKKGNGKIDSRLIFNFVREKIMHLKGWALLEEVTSLSLFSFARFVMWNDIKTHRKKMLENEIVSSFVDGFLHLQNKETVKRDELDEKLPSSSLVIPLPADSSQIEAINASAEGMSFVLDGPPGTGKSQTIANLIVNALYHGKSVLFVAEKGVALEVVKKRLDNLGIGRFCLSIPSINTAKAQVLKELGDMLELGPIENDNGFENDSSSLDELKEKLNGDLFGIHKKDKYVFSIYDALLNCLKYSSQKGIFGIDKEYASNLDLEEYESALDSLKDLSLKGSHIGGYQNNVFLPFTLKEYSLEKREEIFKEIPSLIALLKDFHLTSYNATFKDEGLSESRGNIEAYVQIIKILQENSHIYQEYLSNDAFYSKKEDLEKYLNLVSEKITSRDALLKGWNESFLNVDADMLIAKYNSSKGASSLLERKKIYIRLKKQLRKYSKNKKALKKKDLPLAFAALSSYQSANSKIENYDFFVRTVFANASISDEKELEVARNSLKRTFEIIDLGKKIHTKGEFGYENVCDAIRHLATDGGYLFSNAKTNLVSQYQKLEETLASLKERFGFDLNKYADCNEFYLHAASSLSDATNSKGKLSEWVAFLNSIEDAKNKVPALLIEAYLDGKINEKNLEPSYIYELSYRILIIGLAEKNLGSLNSKITEDEILSYKNAIDSFDKSSIVQTISKITCKYPTSSNSAPSTDNYQLRKLIKNGGRGVSLRQIFDRYSDLIKTLCPCFLMSPIAVAQYLDIDAYNFDIVVFDEASQIPTSEAIGSIARGKSVVIAGDQEQMPPSNFFVASTRSQDGGFASVVNEDLDSLLDDAIALGLQRKRLTWHYRSKHESLIAYSNNKFYENDLLTFPSSSDEKNSVKSIYVGGNYEMRKSTNSKEAEAIVKEIERRLKNDELSKKSIGVVTFNEAQQNLIEDLIEKRIPSVEKKMPGGESIFVKNLENVQGDERDVILFSTTYAPIKGKLSLNFGPLSREKGERRLNVAITRAREEMLVFTSMKASDINAERAKNAGALYLKNFLLFAENGLESLPNNANNKNVVASLSIADFLADDLRRIGYEVALNFGSSNFKVDVAVCDPKNPNSYILGVIVDGDSYVNSPTCRDRNVVEPAILDRLGWKIFRVWSVEYFDHKEEVIKNIVKAINSSSENVSIKETIVPSKANVELHKKEICAHPYAIPYQVSNLHPQKIASWSDDARFFVRNNLKDFIEEVVKKESPISAHYLFERVKQSYGISRITTNVKNRLNEAIKELDLDKELGGSSLFYWDKNIQKNEYRYYRLNDDMTNRDITDISFIELGNAFADILKEQGKMSKIDLYKQTISLFGFNSLTEKARFHLDIAIRNNANKRLDIVLDDDDYVMLKGNK